MKTIRQVKYIIKNGQVKPVVEYIHLGPTLGDVIDFKPIREWVNRKQKENKENNNESQTNGR